MPSSPDVPPPPGPATIRQAAVSDLPAVRDLLTMRDRRLWDESSTRWFVHDLEPSRCVAWLAFAGEKPVGVSTMFLRTLCSPEGPARAGYWANLYIDPAFRGQMLYPRLPMAMFGAAKSLGLSFIYGSVRLRDVALAHTRIGFAKIGELPVLMKPLRPGRLAAKYFGRNSLIAITTPVDWLYRQSVSARRPRVPAGISIEESDYSDPRVEELVEMIRAAGRERVIDSWTPDSFRYRYRQSREGSGYVLLAVLRDASLVGGLIYRIAERQPNIRAGVVMDAICRPGEELAMTAALAEAEQRAYRDGCELMLFLSGLGPAVARVFAASGYRKAPELYDMLVWPKQALASTPFLVDVSHWRFTFADHDAF